MADGLLYAGSPALRAMQTKKAGQTKKSRRAGRSRSSTRRHVGGEMVGLGAGRIALFIQFDAVTGLAGHVPAENRVHRRSLLRHRVPRPAVQVGGQWATPPRGGEEPPQAATGG